MKTNDLQTLLKYMAEQLKILNKKFINISTTDPTNVTVPKQTQGTTFGEKPVTPTPTLLDALKNMQTSLE
jgi:hypothetical protein